MLARHTFVDLGLSPLCESFVAPENAGKGEMFYPLRVFVCEHCFLVQLDEFVAPEEIFTEYAYFSSYSDSWLAHAKRYCEMIAQRLGLNPSSFVVELASNDGYLLRNFVQSGIPCLGVEPARNVAQVAINQGVPTHVGFFGAESASELVAAKGQADLIIGNNVLAQVPDLNDFVRGISRLIKPQGAVTLEFPHLLEMMEQNQFDTIYHEHFSYFSLLAIDRLMASHELEVFDVDLLPTHGGSLRIYARRAGQGEPSERIVALRQREAEAGLDRLDTYAEFQQKVQRTKRQIVRFVMDAKEAGKSVAGYGAPGKGNTLLNYCGVRTDLIEYTCDRNPYKHGRLLPGTRIPIYSPDRIAETQPDYVFVLPWNLKDEIKLQLAYIRNWGGQFVIPIPELTVE
jgi:hypothetical protein